MHFSLEKEDLGFFCVCCKTQAADIALVAVNTRQNMPHSQCWGVLLHFYRQGNQRSKEKSLTMEIKDVSEDLSYFTQEYQASVLKNIKALKHLAEHECTLLNAESPEQWKNARIVRIPSCHSRSCNHCYYGQRVRSVLQARGHESHFAVPVLWRWVCRCVKHQAV